MLTFCNEILGDQPYENEIGVQCFRGYLCLHHQWLMWYLMQLHIVFVLTESAFDCHIHKAVRELWVKSGGHWDRTPVTTSLYSPFPQWPVLWQLRADSVGVNTMCSYITFHISLWWWRQRLSLKHQIPTLSSQSWSWEGIVPLHIKIVRLGPTSHQKILLTRAFDRVHCLSVIGNEQWDWITLLEFALNLIGTWFPNFQMLG